jgi:hypothetical protein
VYVFFNNDAIWPLNAKGMPLLAKRIPFYRRKGKRTGEKNAAHTRKGMGGGYLLF